MRPVIVKLENVGKVGGAVLALGACLVGCASSPPERTGFLSTYEHLAESPGGFERVSDDLPGYHAFIIDDVAFHDPDGWGLDDEQRTNAGTLMRDRCVAALTSAGRRVVEHPGPGVARVRMVLTDVRGSVFLLSLHPGAKITGAGAGGASMEGEVVDSISGEQLLAVVRTGRGNQFELDTFDKFDDLNDVIEAWAAELAERLSVEVPGP